MIGQLKIRICAVFLLIAGGLLTTSVRADSPEWADSQMLFDWPEALGETQPPRIVRQSAKPPAVRRRSSDLIPVDAVVSAARWWPAPSDQAHPSYTEPALIEPTGARFFAASPIQECQTCSQYDQWHVLPDGLLYHSYIAGEKEPRMGTALLTERDRGTVLESALGGRIGLLRYGTAGAINPQGWQWDVEGAALLRQDVEQEFDVEATDFRIGTVLTWKQGPTAVKAGYYHLSSHVGDEFLLRNPTFNRLNYVRDSFLIGIYQQVNADLGIYGEFAYAFNTDGGAEPVELQFGFEYSPQDIVYAGGSPVLAVNGHLREEFGLGGSLNVIAGWQWRGAVSDRRLRIGGQYYNGKEIQWSFFDESVQFVGVGIWYDF